jgi:hypothetical protein
MAVAHQPLAAIIGRLVGIPTEQDRDLVVNRVSRRIMRTKGRKTAEAGRAHEFGPPS